MEQSEIKAFNLPSNFNDLEKENKLKLLEEKMEEYPRSKNEGIYGSLFYYHQIIKDGKVNIFL